jgi:DMSO/TMAO reductase YedYZ molybdopterin-dependent catalytic subunit
MHLNQFTRRRLLMHAGMLGALPLLPSAALAAPMVDLGLPGGNGSRPLTNAFPGKGQLILQRTRPPLLETPFEVFDKELLTPNDSFYVRWHWSNIPTEIDTAAYRLRVHGHVQRPLELSLADLVGLPSVDLVAVNQCSGNSRGFFQPRVSGGQWANGSMGNARWTGVRLKDVLDGAGVGAGAVEVRFRGLDQAVIPGGPDFMKSLAIDHARDGDVMVAYAMNGEALPFLNGFPLRLVVPGWYATYWIKMLSDIEVLADPDQNYWMTEAYLVPDRPNGSISPDDKDVKMVPISRMNPRSFVTNLRSGARVRADAPMSLRGIAFGGDCGVKHVSVSIDGGRNWRDARLDRDLGKYSFRRWDLAMTPARGDHTVLVRCTNSNGVEQPMAPVWNRGGFMQNVIESMTFTAA